MLLPFPPTFTDVHVIKFARHPDALSNPAFVNTIRISLSDGTFFDLDLSFLAEDLAATLVLGNTTGGRDIILTATDSLFGDGAFSDARLNLQFGTVWLTCDGLNEGGWIGLKFFKSTNEL